MGSLILTSFLRLKFVLENKNMNNLQSENLIHFPNVNSLLKISLGVIFFTLLSTVFVYAETITDDNPTVQIVENAHLQNNFQYLDNALFSSYDGTSIEIINNDIVSHKFVSGASNSNNAGQINYDTFIICELGEKIIPTGNNYSDDNLCDFNKDNRIITDIIPPGESISISLTDIGTYRIIDPDYPWIEFVSYIFPKSQTTSDPIEEKIIVEPQVPQTVNVIPAPHIQTISVDVDGTPYDVEYTVNGMTITEIESDIESMSLIFSVDVIDLTGTLDVTLDRTFFDSIYDGTDDLFFILADGDESISEEIETTPQSRTLSIKVPSGTEELEIIGSVFENSKVLEPIVEEPIVEEPIVEEISKNQCGPGTILENNVCVLDQKCGPGTILEDGTCVLDSTTVSSSSSTGISKELIMSVTIAFVIAGIIGIILALISRANRNKN
jgi:hypothetical protein